MHTKDILAAKLAEAGFVELAVKAAQGYYHDFISPLEQPAVQLSDDLLAIGTLLALEIHRQHLNGAFNASSQEAEDWLHSQQGKQVWEAHLRRREYDS